jgi:hypothetical protein
LATVIFTALQAREAIEGNRLARVAHEQERRPWVAIGNLRITKLLISPSTTGAPGQETLWINGAYDLTNSGSTPALAVSTWHLAPGGQLLAPGVPDFDNWVDGLRRTTASGGTRVIAPNEPRLVEFTTTGDFMTPAAGTRHAIGGVTLILGACYTSGKAIAETVQQFNILQRQAPGITAPAGLDYSDIAAGRKIDFVIVPVGVSRMT